jgi:hypothetical protein
MMAASRVSICSNALLLLGGKTINALDEDNDRARLASNLFEPVRNYVLRRHPWNCAVKRVTLSPDVDTPAFDWAFSSRCRATTCARCRSASGRRDRIQDRERQAAERRQPVPAALHLAQRQPGHLGRRCWSGA